MVAAARSCAGLDAVLLVPAGEPPHRPGAHASPADRLAMCRLALGGIDGAAVSDIEVRRPGRSYTIDTLRELAADNPGDELHLVLGWDAARLLPTWRQPQEVLALAPLVVLPRPGMPLPGPGDLAAAGIPEDRVVVCTGSTPAINATDLRRRIARGAALDGLVPEAVERYIQIHNLYREG